MTAEELALMNYNEAYQRWLHCSESEKEKAKKNLDQKRHIWLYLKS